MARQRFQQLQQQAHAQVAEMQEQTNATIEDFRAQAQNYVTDARQQSVQQAERDVKGQYDAKLMDAEQKSSRLETQMQQLQQMQQAQQQRPMMGMQAAIRGGFGVGGLRGGGLRGGMPGGGQQVSSPTPFACVTPSFASSHRHTVTPSHRHVTVTRVTVTGKQA